MLLLAFLLIPAIFAVEQETTINNHIVTIDEDTLISVNTIPTPSLALNLSSLGLRFLAENAFENLTTLVNLDIGNNSLSSIPKGLFSNLRNIENISLANNNLTNFEKNFEGLDHLKTLDISNNPVNYLGATALYGLPKSGVVYTKGLSLEFINAFVFEKEPGPLIRRRDMHKRSITNEQNPPSQTEDQGDLVEMESRRKRDMDISYAVKICIDGDVLKSVEMLNDNETLTSDCRRSEQTEPRLLDLKNLGIAKFEKNWYGLNASIPIIRIRFGGNNIVRVTPELLNDLPANVRNIDLGYNNIERIETEILENPYILVISLKHNAIREIEDGAFTMMPRLLELHLANNLLNNTRFMATLPRDLRILLVQQNRITEISPGSFFTLSALMFLYLNGNQIQEVKSDSFLGLSWLLELILSDNLISKIDSESFQHLPYLYSLALNNNSIVGFEYGTFNYMHSLRNLNVSYNKLSSIKSSFPDGVPPALAYLDLGFNEIQKLDNDSFKNVPLSRLFLSGNKISEIEHGAFELQTLKELKLDHNELVQLDLDSFRGLINIETLNLAHNNITSIPQGFTISMDHLDGLDLSYNPIRKLQNGALTGFRISAYNNILLKGVPVEVIEGGLFDAM